MHGEFFFACSNMSRTRLAPTPTNISTKSDPEIVKNGTPASPAMARARRVLPVPGGPTSSTPRGILAAEPLELLRIAEKFDDLLQILLGFIDTRDILERHTAVRVSVSSFALDFPNPMARPDGALHLPHEEDPDTEDQQHHREASRAESGSRTARFDPSVSVSAHSIVDDDFPRRPLRIRYRCFPGRIGLERR